VQKNVAFHGFLPGAFSKKIAQIIRIHLLKEDMRNGGSNIMDVISSGGARAKFGIVQSF
jgi:hypothetical protein